MKSITRIRIILFALMVFGSFANFALNEWGNTLIVWCEVFMVLSFLGEIVSIVFNRYKTSYRKKLSMIMLSLIGAIVIPVAITCITLWLITKSADIMLTVFGFVILVASILLALTILVEAIYDFFKKIETQGIYESFLLSIFFLALVFKNASFPGTAPMLVFSILFLVPYFVTTTIKFFKTNYKFGKPLVVILIFGSFATILLGIAYMMKTMHWPGATIAFYFAVLITLVMLGGVVKWKYEFNGSKINILEGLRLFKTNVILLFFMLFVFTSYRYLTSMQLAPDFYSADYPESYYKLRNDPDGWAKANEIREAYDNFMQKAEKNGFLK